MALTDSPADHRRRERMVRELGADCPDRRVAQAMLDLPRHWFVPDDLRAVAHADGALAIGAGQTISQPRIVARMLSALSLAPGMRVLDVGVGSGYAATLMARLVAPDGTVRGVERQATLARRTATLLAGIAPAVEVVHGDGLAGDGTWDRIHIGAACPAILGALIDRLRPRGRLIAPIGPHHGVQRLLLIDADDRRAERMLGEVQFVPALPGIVPATDD